MRKRIQYKQFIVVALLTTSFGFAWNCSAADFENIRKHDKVVVLIDNVAHRIPVEDFIRIMEPYRISRDDYVEWFNKKFPNHLKAQAKKLPMLII